MHVAKKEIAEKQAEFHREVSLIDHHRPMFIEAIQRRLKCNQKEAAEHIDARHR